MWDAYKHGGAEPEVTATMGQLTGAPAAAQAGQWGNNICAAVIEVGH